MRNIENSGRCNCVSDVLSAIAMTCALTLAFSGFAYAGPSTVNFGNVPINTTVTQSVAITTDAGYYIGNPSGAGTSAPFGFDYGTCVGVGGFTGPGTCTAIASFSPTTFGLVAEVADILECPVGGGFCPSIMYSVVGTGVSAAAASPTLVDFGNVQINTTASRNVMITVDAGYLFSVTPSGSTEFSFDFGTCHNPFRGPGTCTAIENFKPLVAGLVVGHVDVHECPSVGTCTIGTEVIIHFDSVGTGVAVGPPLLLGAASRRVHGSAGVFDLPLSLVSTSPTTEPRQGSAHTLVFTFDKPANVATAAITEGTATAGAPTFSGNDVIVPILNVGNQQYVTVSLTNIGSADGGSGGSASVRLGFLLGDVNGNRVVTLADLGLVNQQLAQVVTEANFLKDVNVSGTLSLADKGITNANLTKALPPP